MWLSLKDWLFGWLFPLRCLGCACYDTWLCANCFPSNPIRTDRLYALGYYQHKPLQRAIHQLKYKGYRGIATPLGQRLATLIPPETYDLVVPVPLHWRRYLERGYNQTALLGKTFPKPICPVLQKTRRTRNQATLDRASRQSNLIDAFRVIPSLQQMVSGQRILLIDDVYSTGATTQACIKQLLIAGASSVSIAVVALNLPAE